MAAPIRMSGNMLCFTSSEVPNGVSGKATVGKHYRLQWFGQCDEGSCDVDASIRMLEFSDGASG